MMTKFDDYVVVFDLDDTLYKEIDYVRSGRRYVYGLISGIEKNMSEQALLEYPPDEDVWSRVCDAMALPESVKESMLWAYRTHTPDIVLDEGTQGCLLSLRSRARAVAIITDGRMLTQHLKLKALGLEHVPAYVSEVWDGLKPAPARFNAVEARWPGAKYIYAGDNVKKDFVTPNQLNWVTIGVRDDGRNIHAQHGEPASNVYLPKHWINCMTELEGVLSGNT